MRPRPHRTPLWVAAASFLMALALGAGSCLGPPDIDRWRSELAAAEARWRAAGITNYQFVLQRHCACQPSILRAVAITVRAGAFAAAVYADSGTAADPVLWRDYLTVDSQFHTLHGNLSAVPYEFEARYHPVYGYPEYVRMASSQAAVVGDNTITISQFSVLP